jgi:hypothetical protein
MLHGLLAKIPVFCIDYSLIFTDVVYTAFSTVKK